MNWQFPLLIALLCLPINAGTKEWRRHRDAAREALKKNDFTEASASYAAALSEAETAFKGADMRYLETAFEAAGFYNRQFQYQTAMGVSQRALGRLEKPKPGESVYKAALLTLSGDSLLYASKLDEAAAAYDSAYQIAKRTLGPRHTITGTAVRGLGMVAVERKEYEKALGYLDEALRIARQPEAYQFESSALASMFLARRNPRAEANVENLIGTAYSAQDKHADAEKWYRQAIETTERYDGKKSPRLSVFLQNLARTQYDAKQLEAAELTILRALAIDEIAEGGARSFVVSAAVLGNIYSGQDEVRAGDLVRRLIAGIPDGPTPKAAIPICRILVELALKGDLTRAMKLIDAVISAAEPALGPANPELRQLTFTSARALQARKDLGGAEKLYDRFLQSIDPEKDAALTLDAHKALSEIYLAQNRNAEAETLQNKQITSMKKLFGENDSRVANALEDKAAMVEKAGRVDEAASLRAEANRIRVAAFQKR